MTDKEKSRIIVDDILLPSLRRLYKSDYQNILYNVSERNICARLAHHMENIMRSYDVDYKHNLFEDYYADVEYNRMGRGGLKYYANNEHKLQYMVSDLIIQSRGRSRNYLAVELKKKGNTQNADDDRKRLMKLVSSSPSGFESRCVYDTLVGAFIVYSKDDVKIEIYENVGGDGIMTNVILLSYDYKKGLLNI